MARTRLTGTALFDELYAGVNARDLERAMAVYAPDVHFVEPALDWDFHTRAEVRSGWAEWLDVTSLTASREDGFAAGDRVASVWRFSGDLLKPLPGLWDASAVGRHFCLHGVTIAHVDAEGLIGSAREYWNMAEFTAHLRAAS